MPDIDFIKYRPPLDPITYQADLRYPYVELQTTSNFSFLKGASHPEEFVQTAAQLGYHGIALTDHNTLAGVVRGFRIAKETGIPYFIGCKAEILYEAMALASEEILDPEKFQYPCFSVLLHPISRAGYGSLCTLLTLGKRRTTKDHCLLTMQDLLSHTTDLACTIIPPSLFELDNCTSRLSAMNVRTACADLCASWCDKKLLSIALTRSYLPNNEAELQAVIDLAKTLQLPLVATNDARYHIPQRKPLHDVVTCIRAHCTIQTAGYRLMVNQERYLKPPAEMYRLFRDLPQAITRTLAIAEMTKGFSLAELRYEYPSEICPATTTPTIYLRELVTRGIQARYPAGVPEKIQTLLTQELAVIAELAYESYFLTCYDIVRFAREKKILCQGRGAAANSAVCYALGITAVDPNLIETLFARFVSKEREEPPDIDIDFEHERREEVIQYIYEKYGRERAGLTATVISYRSRSAIRDVGKALGWPPTIVDRLAKLSHYWTKQEIRPQDLRALGLDPHSAIVQNLFSLVAELVGFPRHLSQHVGGFIISARPLSETVPILNAAMEGRTTIEWDKDDIELLGLLKLDILALGMLTCIRKALDFVNKTRAKVQKPYELYSIPTEDPAVYQMISAADTIGVFQIESRAQMSMLPRLKPNCFYDLVIQIAIVRPRTYSW
jgi:error-prone DNA polymerase